LRAADRHDAHAFGVEASASTQRERFQRPLVTHALDEDDSFDIVSTAEHRLDSTTHVKGAVMQKRLVTRYAMQSAEAADENQRRVEGVFDELAATKPSNVSYIVLRLADDSFVHVSFHDHGDDEVNPIASTAAFTHFQDGHAERRHGGVDQQTATLVGAYITTID
jgi:hypothetical protein